MNKTRYPSVYFHQSKNSKVKSFYFAYKENKKTVWVKVGTTKEGITAKKAFDAKVLFLQKKRLGENIRKNSAITLNELSKVYFAYIANTKSAKNYKAMYAKHIKKSLGVLKVREIDSIKLKNFQNSLLELGLSAGSVNAVIKLIKRVINFGVKEEMIVKVPFKRVSLEKEDNTRIRFLSLKEIELLEDEVKEKKELYLFVKLALITGARVRSILEIRKKDINFEIKAIKIKDFKRGNSYLAYFNEEIEELLKKRVKELNDQNSKIITKNYSSISYQLRKIFEKLFNKGLDRSNTKDRVVIHTLRHTFASHLAISGVSIQKIQRLMNHSDIRMTMRYAKLNSDAGQKEVENLYEKGLEWV